MASNRVRAGSVYVYNPVPLDRINPPHGVQAGILKPGDRVRVVNLPGCPRANTMGHAHIQTIGGVFAGLVCTNSLDKPAPPPVPPDAGSAEHPLAWGTGHAYRQAGTWYVRQPDSGWPAMRDWRRITDPSTAASLDTELAPAPAPA
jgi:hypothetical protein